ncbi:hypothetical protein Vretimale_2033 [Volvox reticuliferus]|uniref:Uncharacterized protein n=1 Tax=Volvox reticuliferus TaxID=1737510 RepID=A0A8J4D5P4_9CHLO|nr:hypothetical protein Vretifemale_4339 [Volvox reticuliferus]GIL96149.1 hypothetical protein Vretimale_2033 [Volvox reticuliferus]
MAYAAAKPGYSWQEFNEWARDVMERTKKHPGVRAIREWWHTNAERVWPCSETRPSVELAERHAKGLRSKESIRNYFRKYRARRKQWIAGSNSDKTQKVESVAHANDSGEEEDEEDEAGVNRQVLDNLDEQAKHDDEDQREVAETLVTTLNNRPQRTRFAPSRFRSGSASISGGPNDSCGSGSLGNSMDDSEESDADISPERDVASNDKTRYTRSKSEHSRRKPRRSAARMARGGTAMAPDSSRPSNDLALRFGTRPQEHKAPHRPSLEASAGMLSEIEAQVGLLLGQSSPLALLGPSMGPGGVRLSEHGALHLPSLQALTAPGKAPETGSLSLGMGFPWALPGFCVGPHGVRAHEHEALHQASRRALAVLGESPEIDAHEGLLHLLAAAGEHALPPSLGAPLLDSAFLEAMGLPVLPHQAVFPHTWRAGNRSIQEVAEAGISGQSTCFQGTGFRKTPTAGSARTQSAGRVPSRWTPPGAAAAEAGIVGQSAFFQNASFWKTPTPGGAKPQSAGRAIGRCTPGAAAAAPGDGSPYLQLRRMLSAPLITTQALNMFGYDLALNGNLMNELAIQTGADKAHVANHANSPGRPAVEQTSNCNSADEETLRGKTLSTRKRAISDGGHQLRRQKARVGDVSTNRTAQGVEGVEVGPASFTNSDQLQQDVGSCTPKRKASDSTPMRREQVKATWASRPVADAVTPLQSHRKQRVGNSSPDDLIDLADADPSTVIRLGRMLGSDFGVSLYPELGLGAPPQDSEGTSGHLGWPDQDRTFANEADGSRSSGSETSTDEQKAQDCLVDGGEQQTGLTPPTCESGLTYLKQESESLNARQSWVPVGGASSMYGGVYQSGAASPTVNALTGLLYPSGVPRHALHQMPLLYRPPPFPDYPGCLASLPFVGTGWSSVSAFTAAAANQPWQFLDSHLGLNINPPAADGYTDQDARFWDAAVAACQVPRGAGSRCTGR